MTAQQKRAPGALVQDFVRSRQDRIGLDEPKSGDGLGRGTKWVPRTRDQYRLAGLGHPPHLQALEQRQRLLLEIAEAEVPLWQLPLVPAYLEAVIGMDEPAQPRRREDVKRAQHALEG